MVASLSHSPANPRSEIEPASAANQSGSSIDNHAKNEIITQLYEKTIYEMVKALLAIGSISAVVFTASLVFVTGAVVSLNVALVLTACTIGCFVGAWLLHQKATTLNEQRQELNEALKQSEIQAAAQKAAVAKQQEDDAKAVQAKREENDRKRLEEAANIAAVAFEQADIIEVDCSEQVASLTPEVLEAAQLGLIKQYSRGSSISGITFTVARSSIPVTLVSSDSVNHSLKIELRNLSPLQIKTLCRKLECTISLEYTVAIKGGRNEDCVPLKFSKNLIADLRKEFEESIIHQEKMMTLYQTNSTVNESHFYLQKTLSASQDVFAGGYQKRYGDLDQAIKTFLVLANIRKKQLDAQLDAQPVPAIKQQYGPCSIDDENCDFTIEIVQSLDSDEVEALDSDSVSSKEGFRVHKSVLLSSSEAFKIPMMSENWNPDKKDVFEIVAEGDSTPYRKFFHFLHASSVEVESNEEAYKLMALAKMYDIKPHMQSQLDEQIGIKAKQWGVQLAIKTALRLANDLTKITSPYKFREETSQMVSLEQMEEDEKSEEADEPLSLSSLYDAKQVELRECYEKAIALLEPLKQHLFQEMDYLNTCKAPL